MCICMCIFMFLRNTGVIYSMSAVHLIGLQKSLIFKANPFLLAAIACIWASNSSFSLQLEFLHLKSTECLPHRAAAGWPQAGAGAVGSLPKVLMNSSKCGGRFTSQSLPHDNNKHARVLCTTMLQGFLGLPNIVAFALSRDAAAAPADRQRRDQMYQQ